MRFITLWSVRSLPITLSLWSVALRPVRPRALLVRAFILLWFVLLCWRCAFCTCLWRTGILLRAATLRLATTLPLRAIALLLRFVATTAFLLLAVLFQRFQGYLAYVVYIAHVYLHARLIQFHFQFHRLQVFHLLALLVQLQYLLYASYGQRVLFAVTVEAIPHQVLKNIPLLQLCITLYGIKHVSMIREYR